MTKEAPEPWEFAAFAAGPSGSTGPYRPVSATGWSLPSSVRAADGELLCGLTSGSRKFNIKNAGPQMLEGFARLHGLPDDAIAEFARTWGYLGLCEHGLPAWHQGGTSQLPYYTPGKCSPTTRREGSAQVVVEPIASWRAFSREALAILNLAAVARNPDLQLAREDLEALGHWRQVVAANKSIEHAIAENALPGGSTEAERVPLWESNWPLSMRLADEGLNRWLFLGGVRPYVQWLEDSRPELQFFTPGLFGALAVQLVLAVSNARGWAQCSGCQLLFATERRRPFGMRHYCQRCRDEKIPGRDAARDSRANKRNDTPPRFPRKSGRNPQDRRTSSK